MFRSHSRKKEQGAFTLLELIVVVVILVILAAIAIPTFASIIEKSKDETAKQTLLALDREARALAGFRGESLPTETDYQEAAADLTVSAAGVLAATYTVAPEWNDPAASGVVGLKISGTTVGVSMLSTSGNCVMLRNVNGKADVTVQDVAASACTGTSAWEGIAVVPETESTPTPTPSPSVTAPTPSPSPTVPAVAVPATPDAPTVSGNNNYVSLSFPIVDGATSYVVTSNTGLSMSVTASYPPRVYALFQGLERGVTYTFQVVAVNAGGSSASSPVSVSYTPPTYDLSVLGDGPSAYFKMDDTSPVAVNSIANGTPGSYQGSPLYQQNGSPANLAGKSVAFDANDSMRFPRTFTNDFTLEAWIKTSSDTGTVGTFHDGMGILNAHANSSSDFGLTMAGGRVMFGMGSFNQTLIHQTAVDDNKWHHVVASRQMSRGVIQLYVDGVSVDSNFGDIPAFKSPVSAGTHIYVGGSNVSGVGRFEGRVDEVAVYPRALSGGDVVEHYNLRSLPADITELNGVATTTGDSALDWTGPSAGVSYRIYRDSQLVGTTSGLSYQDRTAEPYATYSYRVGMVKDGVETYSNTVEVSIDSEFSCPNGDFRGVEGVCIIPLDVTTEGWSQDDPSYLMDNDSSTGWLGTGSITYLTNLPDARSYTLEMTADTYDVPADEYANLQITALRGDGSQYQLGTISLKPSDFASGSVYRTFEVPGAFQRVYISSYTSENWSQSVRFSAMGYTPR